MGTITFTWRHLKMYPRGGITQEQVFEQYRSLALEKRERGHFRQMEQQEEAARTWKDKA